MHVVRFDAAPPYAAPGHEGMRMVRLQGREAGPADLVWLGVSTIEPGGGATLSASEVEKMYVVLDGEVTLSNGETEIRLGPLDSCRIAPREGRILRNDTRAVARILLAMPFAPTPAR